MNEVLVVGAGPTGLLMASEMLRHGVPVRLVEKLTEPSDKSKALAIHARSLEMLENIGVVKDMMAAGIECHGFSMYNGDQRIIQFSTAELDSPYPIILMIPQQETERVLREHFESLGGRIERGIELVSLTQDKDQVTVQLKHADGKEETVTTPWLLSCDGSHSVARKQLNLPFEGAAYEEPFALGDCDIESDLPEDEVTTFFHQDGPMVYFPMGNKRFRLMAPVEDKDISGDAPTVQFLEELATKRCRPGMKFKKSHWLTWFKIHRRSVPHYSVGRVFLAGDSAHIHSPVGGQGMNTGMQDAYNLAWKLALVYKGLADQKLLDSYNEERHPVGKQLLQGTDIATRAAVLRNPVAKYVRNQMIHFLGQQEVFINRMRSVATMVAVNYRKSPIVGEYHELGDVKVHSTEDQEAPSLPAWMDFARAPLPGDRAPDVMLYDRGKNDVRLFEAIQGTKHSLVLFDGKPTEEGYKTFAKIAERMVHEFSDVVTTHVIVADKVAPDSLKGIEHVYCDPMFEAHEKYGAQAEAMYLIRPDGFIGFRAQPAKIEPLVAYLNKLLGKAAVTAVR